MHREPALGHHFLNIAIAQRITENQRTHWRMIPSRKCRPRNNVARLSRIRSTLSDRPHRFAILPIHELNLTQKAHLIPHAFAAAAMIRSLTYEAAYRITYRVVHCGECEGAFPPSASHATYPLGVGLFHPYLDKPLFREVQLPQADIRIEPAQTGAHGQNVLA